MASSYKNVKSSRERLKERIIYVMGGKCQCCGYNKCSSALELHHLNPLEKDFTIGKNTNRGWETIIPEIKKCILVCANCHREIESGIIDNSKLVSSFNEEKANEISKLIKDIKTKKIYYCKNCGKEVSSGNDMCPNCAHLKSRKVERPNRQELKDMIRKYSFTQIGKKYEVSDNTIRKWCDTEKLPRTKKEINTYSDEEWDLL